MPVLRNLSNCSLQLQTRSYLPSILPTTKVSKKCQWRKHLIKELTVDFYICFFGVSEFLKTRTNKHTKKYTTHLCPNLAPKQNPDLINIFQSSDGLPTATVVTELGKVMGFFLPAGKWAWNMKESSKSAAMAKVH